MKKSALLVSFFIFLAGCNATFTAPVTVPASAPSVQSIQHLFSGIPTFSDIHTSIRTSNILTAAPLPRVTLLNYESIDLRTHRAYSNYQIRLQRTGKHKLTEYRTTEVTPVNNRLYGFGVGYGGIISIAYLKHGSLSRHPNYFIQYQWTHISNIQGHLFPLKVGNWLSFSYQDLTRHHRRQTPGVNSGEIVYQVLRKMHGYNNGLAEIPGLVYVIKYSKTTRQQPQLNIQNIYYFSKRLGWYVYAKYYTHHKAEAEYQLVNYR